MIAGLPSLAVEVCRCPACLSPLRADGERLGCTRCGEAYDVVDGVPVLLRAADALRVDYRESYERLARDDLAEPVVAGRFALLHAKLVSFIGDVSGQRVLDIGSAYGSYLRELSGARERVALDLALPYLRAMSDGDAHLRVCADAEDLPVALDRFDVIVLSDVLEHVLDAEAVVARLRDEVRADARIIVHVPWEESLEPYRDSEYRFTHLRSFDEFSLRLLFHGFAVRRAASSLPDLGDPLLFRLRGRIPAALYELLVQLYFSTNLPATEYRRRARWIAELPARERWLLRLYPAQVRMFELRRVPITMPRRAAVRAIQKVTRPADPV